MKKLVFLISLVLATVLLTVPVSAAGYMDLSNQDQTSALDIVLTNLLQNFRPDGYNYEVVLTSGQAVTVIFCVEPTLTVGTKIISFTCSTTASSPWSNFWGTVSKIYPSYQGASSPSTLSGCTILPTGSVIPGAAYVLRTMVADRSTASFPAFEEYNNISTFSSPLIANFGNPVDTSELETLITTAESRDSSQYTPSTWSALQTALADAKARLSSGNYTQKTIDSHCSTLQSALNGLTLKDLTPPIVEPPDPDHYDYLIDGFRVQDLAPAKDAMMANFHEARKFGISVFAVLLIIFILTRIVWSSVSGLIDPVGHTIALDRSRDLDTTNRRKGRRKR